MKTKYWSILCILCLAVIPAWADAPATATNRYTGDLWKLVDAQKVMAAATDITLAKYPDCDEATIDKNLVRVYRADGTGECQDESFTKVLTEKGKRNNRTMSLSFMLPYSTEEVTKLEIIKPDGTVLPVDIAANSKETIDESQMQMNIYDPNSRILQVNIPKVEIGDVVHAVSRQTILRSYMAGEYAEENVFEDEGYIRHISYEVHAPADRPLARIALRDEVPGTVHYSTEKSPDGGTIHRWEVNNVPRMFDEPSMPPADMVLQRVLVSTTPQWQDVSKWYWNLSKAHLLATEGEMTNTVNELTASAKTDMDKLKAIFYYVSKNIRYMGLTSEKDRPGFEPHDVKITFDKKYGVCRDKAALLVSLLRTAGLNSYPVLISVGTKRDKDVPDPFFNHAIVSVEISKGKYVLMDPTDEHTRNLLPSYDCDQSYLVCRPEGENLQVSAIEPPEDHMMEIKTTGELTAAGAFHAKSELYFGGVNDDAYRNAFSHMKPDDERRFFERTLKRALPGARLDSYKLYPEDMMDTSVAIHAELVYSADGMTANGNGTSMVSIPWIGKNFGMVNFIIGGCGLDKRKYPMLTEVACGMQESLSIKMADGFEKTISMPNCPGVDDDCVTYGETVAYKDGALDCGRTLKLKVVEFSPKQYLTLKQTLKSIEYDERKVPVLTIAANAATEPPEKAATSAHSVDSDAKILRSDKEFVLTDAQSGVYHAHYIKQILNYAGKIREAEIKINYNPSCQEARLLRGTVTSKTGEKQEIATNEINVMDAGWNPSAKRYTGEKILVANLPGVDVGSTIDVEFIITNKGKPFLGGFEPFQLRDEMAQKTFRLTVPTNLLLHTRISDPTLVSGETNTANGTITYTWRATNVTAMPAEGQTPPDWVFAAGVGYYAGEMKPYLQSLYDTMLDRSKKSEKVAAMTKQLVDGKSKLEAVKAIRDFVAKSIREAGPAFTELPLTELSAADTTLTYGYGHAADHAILLHAMLTAAGFEPHFVLASDLPQIQAIDQVSQSFPLPYSFAEPLVRVAVDGQTYYLNDTDQYAKLGSTGYDQREILVLPVDSSRDFEIAHAVTNCEDKVETVYTMSIADNGKTRIGVTHSYYGEYYESKNRYFSELPPEERRRYYQELVSSVAQGAHPVGDLKTDFATYPGIEQCTVDVDNYTVVDGKYIYFDLPFTPSLGAAGADQRTLPLYLNQFDRNTVRTEIELPAAFSHEVIAPQSQQLVVPDQGGVARITATESPGRVVVTHEFDSSPTIIPPADYPAMLKLESRLERKSSRVFLFSSAAP